MNTRLVVLAALLTALAVGAAVLLLAGDGEPPAPPASAPVRAAADDGADGELRPPLAPGGGAAPQAAPASVPTSLALPAADSRAARITGRVVTRGGEPVAGAVVELLSVTPRTALRRHRPLGLSVHSAADGRFDLQLGAPGSGDLALSAGDGRHAPAFVEPLRPVAGRELAVGDVVLEPGVRLFGKVSSSGGGPLPGARLLLRDLGLGSGDPAEDEAADEGVLVGQTEADGEGAYRFDGLGKRQYTLDVSAPGHAPVTGMVSILLAAPEAFEQDFVLEAATLPMGGLVLDPDERGVPGVTLRITRRRPNASSWYVDETTTGDDGRFLFDAVPEGRYETTLSAAEVFAERVPRLEAGRLDHEVRVHPALGIDGQLVADGALPERFEVDVLADGRSGAGLLGGRPRRFTVRQPEVPGAFSVEGLRPGEYQLEVTAAGFAPSRSQTLILGGEARRVSVPVLLRRGGTLTGRLAPPRGGVPVELRPGTWDPSFALEHVFPTEPVHGLAGTTRDDGGFALAHVPEGRYVLTLRPADGPPLHVRDVAVADGSTTDVGAVSMPRGGALHGTVLGHDGRPLARARVQITGDTHTQTATTGIDGTFRLDLVPAGRYQVTAMPNDFMLSINFEARAEADVLAGEDVQVDLLLTRR